jgi:hypothetical protein
MVAARRLLVPSEHAEQVAFVRWFRLQYRDVRIIAIPNGGKRHIGVARKLKAEGVESGVPDTFVPAWSLWVEMKRQKGGVLSKNQREWKAYLESIGHTVIVANGWREARERVMAEVVRNGV